LIANQRAQRHVCVEGEAMSSITHSGETPISALTLNERNARTHSKKQISQIARSITEYGFTNPIIADEKGVIIAGHGRLEAARSLGLRVVPVITVAGLSDARKRALLLADNKIAENAGWDRQKLAFEIPELSKQLEIEGSDITLTGFDVPEIDQLLVDFGGPERDPDDDFHDVISKPISRLGDLWLLGPHRLLCGNARIETDLDRLMGGASASMAFLDPPYNVSVASVVGRGKTKHREFAEASGEQTPAEFRDFLTACLSNAVRVSSNGSLHYVCMDWRNLAELTMVANGIYGAHINTAVWTKTNAGQGSFYRSQHEEILVLRVGDKGHLNNVELGRHGRSRSNVWPYAGVNTFRKGRMDDLRDHPTVKPVALVSDAMRDCTKRRDIVLDTFCGSGTTILAAERVGRLAYGLELDPTYVDTAIRRWQAITKNDAVHADTGVTFDELAPERLAECNVL
jgi:DNA modification methylase